jgi:hypothetical protein
VTDDETALARTLTTMPGFPKFDDIGGVHVGSDYASGYPLWFANDLVWVGVDLDARGEWIRVPLLTHGGTAGILLGMLHAVSRGVVTVTWYHMGALTICGKPAWSVSVLGVDGQSGRVSTEGEHLGVAVARALVAIGRAS